MKQGAAGQPADDAGVRLDTWLWAARFYRLRSLAAEAVKGGHVWINGARARPAKAVRIGDALRIHKQDLDIELVVAGLARRRGPASVARTLYEEAAESIARRSEQAEQRRLVAASSPAPDKRPDKRDRRHIMRFKSG